jgi:bifunctional DNase/RNase
VVITELRDRTFFAEIRLLSAGQRRTVSARPSDAVALAVRVSATIYAEEALVDAEGYVLAEDVTEEDDDGESDELLGQFRDFIDGIRPEDFEA